MVRYNLAITLFASNRPAEGRAEADLLRGLDPDLSAKLEALIRRNSQGN